MPSTDFSKPNAKLWLGLKGSSRAFSRVKILLQTDLTLVLYANTDTLRSRIINRDDKSSSDTFESKPDDFQRKLNKGYQKIITDFNLPAINTNDKTIDEVHNEIIKHISNVLN